MKKHQIKEKKSLKLIRLLISQTKVTLKQSEIKESSQGTDGEGRK